MYFWTKTSFGGEKMHAFLRFWREKMFFDDFFGLFLFNTIANVINIPDLKFYKNSAKSSM